MELLIKGDKIICFHFYHLNSTSLILWNSNQTVTIYDGGSLQKFCQELHFFTKLRSYIWLKSELSVSSSEKSKNSTEVIDRDKGAIDNSFNKTEQVKCFHNMNRFVQLLYGQYVLAKAHNKFM